jgi:hypothetical protein
MPIVQEMQSVGTSEHLNFGARNFGVQELRSAGTLVRENFGARELRCAGTSERGNFSARELRSAGTMPAMTKPKILQLATQQPTWIQQLPLWLLMWARS